MDNILTIIGIIGGGDDILTITGIIEGGRKNIDQNRDHIPPGKNRGNSLCFDDQ